MNSNKHSCSKDIMGKKRREVQEIIQSYGLTGFDESFNYCMRTVKFPISVRLMAMNVLTRMYEIGTCSDCGLSITEGHRHVLQPGNWCLEVKEGFNAKKWFENNIGWRYMAMSRRSK